MTIETKLEFKSYLRLMYVMTYRKPIMIFLTLIGIVMVSGSLGYLIGFNDFYSEPPIVPGALGFTFIFLLPFSIFRGAKKNFSSNGRLQEIIKYDFTDEKIIITGESFHSEMDWNKTYKILELKKWILLYQNRQVFNVIPIESFGENLKEFKSLARKKNIKLKLKK